MSREKHPTARTTGVNGRSSRDFADYCAAEFERRRNSGEDFDEPAYRAAMDIALKRLERLEDAGLK